MIDDNPGASPLCVMSKLKRKGSSTAAAIGDVSAVAVREKGTAAHCKVLRFYYCVSPQIERAIQAFTAVPKNHSIYIHLFTKQKDDGSLLDPLVGSLAYRDILERHNLSHCEVMAIAPRCADWFVLRKFRVTGTIADQILMRENVVRSKLRLQSCSNEIYLPPELIDELAKSWFSASRSTEHMMRGTINEDSAFAALSNKQFVKAVYSVGMISCMVGK